MNDMIIRKFDENDKKQVLTLVEKTLYELFKVKPKNIELDEGLFKNNGVLYVAEDDGKIVGIVGIKKHKEKVA